MNGLPLLGALIVLAMPLAAQEPGSTSTQKVVGIGGLFFRARDPSSLARWYEKHLGVAGVPSSYDDRGWMVNFRVRDLTAIVAQLRASGIAVNPDPKIYPNGRFARLHDPEGNAVELWEPATPGTPKSLPSK